MKSVFIAIGTNVGNKIHNIHKAVNGVREIGHVVATSYMYTSEPMYFTEQDTFLNCVIKIQTECKPFDLLHHLKQVEAQMGRDFSVARNGPRVIDLDIIFYDSMVLTNKDLTIPHPLMHERDFVLVPMCDIDPQFIHPVHTVPIHQLTQHISSTLKRVLPLHSRPSLKWGTKTYLMGILNITPDSFSDGGDLYDNIALVVQRALQMKRQGADILDIGGQSTRPNAERVTEDIELSRVVPVIKALREQQELSQTIISIDTFYASVASEAINHGADIVNDISGGTMDDQMFKVVSELYVPIVIMHIRGTPTTMHNFTDYNNDTIGTVTRELVTRVQVAQDTGILKWNVIIDPGIGFAKTQQDNLLILRDARFIIQGTGGYPCLIGASRKGFIGNITGKEPKDRVHGTSVTVVASIQNGCDIVRVHDVDAMSDVIKLGDAIWR
jgi:dihydroneopterin aldolase/2-amino-4-hydroxy-6-hydroxymethyldihydropteridine diphosphokinase/dihydropteroate synthase/2-amino-4-hydroxy-6-hydroxymethyldihydropteridine diphosphokinase/dihydropteroate synthase